MARARNDLGQFVSLSELFGDQVDRDTDKASRSFTMFGGTLLKAVGYILAAGAAANILSGAFVGIVAVTQSFVPVITASLATLPGIILAAAGAAVVLKLAMVGVGDAIKAAFAQDPAKFEAAIKKLAPEAQNAAKALYAVGAAAKPLQQAVQNAFFAATAPLVAQLIPAIQSLTPMLVGVATGFNGILRSVLGFAGSQVFIDAVGKSLKGVEQFLTALAPGFAPLLTGFASLAGQAGKFFESFGDRAAQALAQFGGFLGALDLDAMWQTASTVLKNLGTLFSDLGTIIGTVVGVFTGAGAAVDDFGGSVAPLANGLGILVSKMAEFVQSADGMDILNALAMAMSAVASAGGDVLLSLLTALSPILVELGPLVQSLARAIGPVLGAAFAALSPALTTVANALRTSLGPVLPSLVEAFTALAPVIGQIAAVFGGVLGAALQVLVPVLARLAVIASGILLQALTALLPHIEKWGQAFQEVASTALPQLIPLLNQLGPLISQLIPFVTQASIVFLTLLIPAMRLMGPVISVAIGYLSSMIGLWSLAGSALSTLGSIFASVWNAVLSVTSVTWNLIRSVVNSGTSGITTAVSGMVNLVKGILSGLASVPGQVGGYFRSMVSAVTGAIGSLLGAVRAVPGQIQGALGNLGGLLVSAGRDVINGFIAGIRSMAGAAVAAARAAVAGVPGAIKGALGIGSPSKVAMLLGREVPNGLAIGISQTADRVESAILAVANMIPAQIASSFEGNAIANGSVYTNGVLGGGQLGVAQPTVPAPSAGVTVTQNITTMPHQSAEEIGAAAIRRLDFGVMTGTSSLVPGVA